MKVMSKSIKKIKTNARLINELLTRYRNTFLAFCELINNAIQAQSTRIDIDIAYGTSALGGAITSLSIKDNGTGVAASEFEDRILEIGTTAKAGGQGIGRFGALQIGKLMTIDTVAFDKKRNQYTQVSFELNVDLLRSRTFHNMGFEVDERILATHQHTYYKVTIGRLHSNSGETLARKNRLSHHFLEEEIGQAIFERYPFLIFNSQVEFYINSRRLERSSFVCGAPVIIESTYKDTAAREHTAQFTFYNVSVGPAKVKVFFYVNHAAIKTVAHEFTYSSDWHTPDLGTWFIYIDSPLFTPDLFRNIDMSDLGDEEWRNLKEFIKKTINAFFKARNNHFDRFVARLACDDAARHILKSTHSTSETSVFNKVAYFIEGDHKFLEHESKDRFLIYPLIHTAIKDGHIRSLLLQLLNLKDDTRTRLKELLNKTDLESIINFSSKVAQKSEFLDFLHEITYGDVAKVLLERKQLHLIIEENLWLFGESYADTPKLWSDRKIGKILEELHREYLSYSPHADDGNLAEEAADPALSDITDLFFYNEKIADGEIKEIMIVELKSPKCAIHQKEINQIDRYAYAIEKHAALPQHNTRYKLVLISSRLTDFAESKLRSAREKFQAPFMYDHKTRKDIAIYIMTWRELIELNKRKLMHLSHHLQVKERSIREKFETEYADLIDAKTRSMLKRVG